MSLFASLSIAFGTPGDAKIGRVIQPEVLEMLRLVQHALGARAQPYATQYLSSGRWSTDPSHKGYEEARGAWTQPFGMQGPSARPIPERCGSPYQLWRW